VKPAPFLVALLIVGLQVATPSAEQRVTIRDVLDRAGKYASDYRDALATVVADEHYVQELVSKRFESILKKRSLESEVAFVRPTGTDDWLAFRSVLRVDEEPVENEAGKLDRIFKSEQAAPLEQLRAIANESARHHLGALQRNFNIPTLVLQFLLPSYQPRFRFDRRGEEDVGGERVWVIEYEERDRPRIIRTPRNEDVKAGGRIWIVPADGRVVRATLELDSPVRTNIEFEWAPDKNLGLWVPSQMREHYRGRIISKVTNSVKPDEYDIRGLARYTNYRRFKTDARMK
jgi:hypothetical protein